MCRGRGHVAAQLHKRLSTIELLPYASGRWNGSLPLPATTSPNGWVLVPLDTKKLSQGSGYERKLATKLGDYNLLATGYQRGVTSAIYDVEDSVCSTWSHAQSQRSLLSMTDSDGQPRRLDFVGRVESLTEDLRTLLRMLHVSDSQLSPAQRAYLDGDSHKIFGNSREGFRGVPSSRYQIAAHIMNASRGGQLRRRIFARYRADFECLNYSMEVGGEEFGYSEPQEKALRASGNKARPSG